MRRFVRCTVALDLHRSTRPVRSCCWLRRSLPFVSLDGMRKELDGRYSARKAQMSDEDAELIGRLFISCAKAAGGAHETLRGKSINVSTILSMTAHSKPQTIHADDTIQSLAIIFNASPVAVMGPEFLRATPVPLTGVGIGTGTQAGLAVRLPAHSKADSKAPCSCDPRLVCCAPQNRQRLIEMWTSLEKNETRPDVVESGVLAPGDCVFFNPAHPHRGPQEPFPSTPDQSSGSTRSAGKRAIKAPSECQLPADSRTRMMIFMSATHTRGSSEAAPIFATHPPFPRRGRFWRDAFLERA